MTDKYFPYHKIIDEMQKRVNTCDLSIINSLRYFLRESQGEYGPSQAVTLPDEVIKEIDNLIYKFKQDCYCGNANSIIWGDHSAYTGESKSQKKKGISIK
jgi:hypothetical protein